MLWLLRVQLPWTGLHRAACEASLLCRGLGVHLLGHLVADVLS